MFYYTVCIFAQVFHMCQPNGNSDSFLCPNGTVFNQVLIESERNKPVPLCNKVFQINKKTLELDNRTKDHLVVVFS
jgi:hypothetical protein